MKRREYAISGSLSYHFVKIREKFDKKRLLGARICVATIDDALN